MMQELEARLGEAGLAVIAGRNRGSMSAVSGIRVELTGTGEANDGAGDVNTVVRERDAAFYIDRKLRLWALAVGPVGAQTHALVLIAAYRPDNVSEGQQELANRLVAVLTDIYQLEDSDADPDLEE